MGSSSTPPRPSSLEEAYARGAKETALAFTDLVDDCDRAIQALKEGGALESVTLGVEGARNRMLEHLLKHDIISISPLDEKFDPLFHEAIAVEPSQEKDGLVVKVHRRGWLMEEVLVRPAMVTVCQGAPQDMENKDEEEELMNYQPEESLHIEVTSKPKNKNSTKSDKPRRRRTGGAIPGFTEDVV
jgi:hypothetical protein